MKTGENSLKEYQRSVLAKEYLFIIIVGLVLFFINKLMIIGLVWGACFSIINFNLKVKRAEKFAEQPYAGGKIFFNYLLRYFLFFLGLFIAFKFEKINIVATVIGIFSIYLIIFIKEIVKYNNQG